MEEGMASGLFLFSLFLNGRGEREMKQEESDERDDDVESLVF